VLSQKFKEAFKETFGVARSNNKNYKNNLKVILIVKKINKKIITILM